MRTVRSGGLCRAAGVYGYFPCEHRGGGLLEVEDGRGGTREFRFPVESRPAGRTVAAYFEGPEPVHPPVRGDGGGGVPPRGRGAEDIGGPRGVLPSARPGGFPGGGGGGTPARPDRQGAGRRRGGVGREALLLRLSRLPGVEAQRDLLALLGADRIGLGVTEGHQLTPEFSVTALVVPRSDAEYFQA